jgi:hypothetical protein
MSRKRPPSAELLTKELAKAVAAKDTARAIELTRQIESQLQSDLKETNGASRDRGSGASSGERPSFAAAPAVVPVHWTARSAGSARQTITAALSEIGVPAKARLVADYAEARFGDRVDTRGFSALRRDERRAWASSSPRPTYIVPALEGRFFQPIRGLLALSDWPIERRLMGPWSERTDHLAATAQMARQLAWLSERDRAVAVGLASVVAGMARSVPGALDGPHVDTARVEAAVEAELAEFEELDKPWRSESAARARKQLSPEEQLWGRQVKVVGAGES